MNIGAEDHDGGVELLQRHYHFFQVFSLRHNTQVVFNRKDLGCSSAEDCLVIGQNDLQHLFASFFADEFVLIDDARHAIFLLFAAAGSCLLAHDASCAVDLNVSGSSQHFGWKSDVKFNG